MISAVGRSAESASQARHLGAAEPAQTCFTMAPGEFRHLSRLAPAGLAVAAQRHHFVSRRAWIGACLAMLAATRTELDAARRTHWSCEGNGSASGRHRSPTLSTGGIMHGPA